MVTRAVRAGARQRAACALLAPDALLFFALGALSWAVVPGRTAAAATVTSAGAAKEKAHAAGKNPGSVRGTPGEESQSERRAVRGVPVDDGIESPELSELRRFEEQAFPRGRADPDGSPDADTARPAPPGLPGRWEGTGDVPEVLRSPEATAEPASRVAPMPDSDWLRGLKLPELPVRWDPQVLRYLDYFKNDARGRAVMTNWLRRAGRYRPLIDAALEREGLPKDLFFVAMVESGFDTSARSHVGAGGIWQFMPGAARAYGLEVGYWIDARRDPERSVEAAARYLKDLYVRFGSWPLVFAAYNAGYGAVLKSITRYNTNDYWELCRHEAGLPWESSLYVPKILAAAIVGHNLEAFGYADIVPDPPFSYDKVNVPAGTTLATVARAARTKPETLEALNPQLTRDRTPPDRGATALRIPSGASAAFAEAFERARSAGDRLETVTLRFGETLDDVAKARGTSARELRRLNGVKDSGDLRAGVAIVVPRKKAGKAEAGKAEIAKADENDKARGEGDAIRSGDAGDERDAAAGTGAAGDDDEILVAVPDRVFSYEGRERVFYRTRDGDALDEVAEAFGVRPDDLVEWNNLDPGAKLHPKMVLQVFVRKEFDPTAVVLLDPARVRVVTLGSQEFLELEAARRGKKRLVIETKAGDTLVKLGRRYGLTLGDLARINRFSYNTELRDGQKVVVYSPMGEAPRDLAQGLAPVPRRDRGVTGAVARSGGAATKGPAAKPSGKGAALRTASVTAGEKKERGGERAGATSGEKKEKGGEKTSARPAGEKKTTAVASKSPSKRK